MNTLKTAIALAGMMAGSLVAFGDVSWQGNMGGDLSDPANWGMSALPADGKFLFPNNINSALTLSKNFDGVYWPYFNKAAPFTLDLDGHTLTVPYRMHIEGGTGGSSLARVEIRNGTVAMKSDADRIFIGDQTMYNQLNIGSGGKLKTSDSAYLFLGNNKHYNWLTVKEGGQLEGAVNVGQKANSSTVTITGNGSTWSSLDNRSILIGDGGANCELKITDGGKAVINGELRVGYGQNAKGTKVTVGDRGVLELGGNVNFGASGANTVVDIQSGGTIALTKSTTLHVGANSTACDCVMNVAGLLFADLSSASAVTTWYVGANSSRSQLVVMDGGVVALTNVAWNVGNAQVAKDNLFEIQHGGTVRLACPASGDERFNLGIYGSGNALRVNGGLLDAPGCAFILGGKKDGASNVLTVENGGLVNARRVIIGDKGPSNALCVSNATLALSSSLDAGYSSGTDANPAGCTITVAGSESRITCDTLRLRNDAALIFKLSAEPPSAAPVACNALEAAPAASIQVEFEGELPTARDIPLVTTTVDMTETVISRLKATAKSPARTRLRIEPRKVSLRVYGKFTVILR